jgi:hypothetical protein
MDAPHGSFNWIAVGFGCWMRKLELLIRLSIVTSPHGIGFSQHGNWTQNAYEVIEIETVTIIKAGPVTAIAFILLSFIDPRSHRTLLI